MACLRRGRGQRAERPVADRAALLRSIGSVSLLWCALATSAGCALTLDYDPPAADTGARMDGGQLDVGPVECAPGDACDDGLACTVDTCASGICQHAVTCAEGDCIARRGGVCQRACAGDADCDDGVGCTDDTCSPLDGHCEHTSSCDASRPLCLPTGACVPTTCASDEDCDDTDACNGHERCVDGTCRGGAPVVCPASPTDACAPLACDPRLGQCVRTPDDARCNDGVDCTVDVCVGGNGDFACENTPDDLACDDGSQCTTEVCDASSGCVVSQVECNATASCITGGSCNPSTGACDYTFSCAAGQVCTPSGCQVASCENDAQCLSLVDPTGCTFHCVSGTCVPGAHCAPFTGECGVADALCAEDAISCHYRPDDTVCADTDPASLDTCNPSTFACEHTCPDVARDCVTSAYDLVQRRCVSARDDDFCVANHPAGGASDCTRWICVGSAATADGCQRVAANADCEDGYRCTDDVCMLQGDGSGRCQRQTNDAMCDDGASCTQDHCEPALSHDASGCAHEVHDDVCTAVATPFDCAEIFCVGGGAPGPVIGGITFPNGCAVRYASCDMSGHPGAYCNPVTGLCEPNTTGCSGGSCDDGNPCNGTELCIGVRCLPGAPPMCLPDPMGCLTTCDQTTGHCTSPSPGFCIVP